MARADDMTSVQCKDEHKEIFTRGSDVLGWPLWEIMEVAADAIDRLIEHEETKEAKKARLKAEARGVSDTRPTGVRQVSPTVKAVS